MTFDELRDGETIFLDANIFVYHFLGLSQQCKQLLKRCREGRLRGKTASFILAETVHRLMVAEAVEQKLVTSKNAFKKLLSQAGGALIFGHIKFLEKEKKGAFLFHSRETRQGQQGKFLAYALQPLSKEREHF